ncbi:MAG: hypothetical protein RQ745_04885 [Longimicrobiales bacterium]|nr:hypothetical protein [Longimicrobiales bacterium]
MAEPRFRTIGELKQSGYRSRTVKDTLRANQVRKLQGEETLFPGVRGYDEAVVPQIVNAFLAPGEKCVSRRAGGYARVPREGPRKSQVGGGSGGGYEGCDSMSGLDL